MAKDRRSDGAGDEADRIDGKRLQHADQRVGFREEQFPEDQPGDDTVEQKIIPLDRRADRAGDDGPAQLGR
jgi:hypothetical protein